MRDKQIVKLEEIKQILIESMKQGLVYKIAFKDQLCRYAQQENSYPSNLKNTIVELVEYFNELLEKVPDWKTSKFNVFELRGYLNKIESTKINKKDPFEEIRASVLGWQQLVSLMDEEFFWLDPFLGEIDTQHSDDENKILNLLKNKAKNLQNKDQRVIFYKEALIHLFTRGRSDLAAIFLTTNEDEIREAAEYATSKLSDLQDMYVETSRLNSHTKLGQEKKSKSMTKDIKQLYKKAAQEYVDNFLAILEEEENFELTKEAADYAGRQFPEQPSLPTTVNYPYLEERGNYNAEQTLKAKQYERTLERLKKLRDRHKKEDVKN